MDDNSRLDTDLCTEYVHRHDETGGLETRGREERSGWRGVQSRASVEEPRAKYCGHMSTLST